MGELHELTRAVVRGAAWADAVALVCADVLEDVIAGWADEVARLAAMTDPPMWSDLEPA